MNNSLTAVRDGYDRWAEVYDRDANPMQAIEEPIVRAAVGNPRGLHVLDLGCGTGRHSLWLADAGAEVTAIDFSAGMLAKAADKSGAERIKFIVHDLHLPLPVDDRSFDLVVCGLVIEHLSDLNHFFKEVHRVLRPEGRAVVSIMHPAMFLRASQARFTDPQSGKLVQPGSLNRSLSVFYLAISQAGLRLTDASEFSPDEEFAHRYPRAEKYIDWPMLVVVQMTK